MSTFDPEQVVTALRSIAESQQLRQQAEEGCRIWLQDGAAENDLRGWSLDEIEVHFDRCALVFGHGILSYPFVETKLGLYVHDPSGFCHRSVNDDGLISIGHYRLITLLDGTADDDYFVLEVDKQVVGSEEVPDQC